MVNWTLVFDWPSVTREVISSTPLTPRTAASMRWVTWVSISVGAAPGCTTVICAAGKSISGLSLMFIDRKLTMPASVSMMNSTIGGMGFLIAQLEILRIGRVPYTDDLARTGAIFSPGRRKAAALTTTLSSPFSPVAIATP